MRYKIAVVGLGYVGLPLARLFATKYPVVGYDIDSKRVNEIIKGKDYKNEVSTHTLNQVLVSNQPFALQTKGLFCTSDATQLEGADFYIVTVPTPVSKDNIPDLAPLIKASEVVGKVLKKGNVVIYESTVYPGVTEDICVPVLEDFSGLKFNEDFFCGYSPERLNPGDREKTIEKIIKLTAGSTPEIGIKVDELYRSVITAGTHLTPSIKVAEAAKVIENAQRDINIAFMNELAKIFSLMDIDTQEVLAAARTKWNFVPFNPGLVGGHCIGVDPFYLAEKAKKMGYHSELIFLARKLNDSMGSFVAAETVKLMIRKDISLTKASVLILGFTFKENCNDIRNTKVIDVIQGLEDYDLDVITVDPYVSVTEVKEQFNITVENDLENLISSEQKFDAIVLAVSHKEFLNINFSRLRKEKSVVYDVKGVLPVWDKRL